MNTKLRISFVSFIIVVLLSTPLFLDSRSKSNTRTLGKLKAELTSEELLLLDNSKITLDLQYEEQNSDLPVIVAQESSDLIPDIDSSILDFGQNFMGGTFKSPVETNNPRIDTTNSNEVNASAGSNRFAEGLDVSQWQGTIDWNQVYAAGYTFTYAKSTEGNCYVDPTYDYNMKNGDAAGVYMGSYHFARPDLTGGNPQLVDAQNEAICFANWVVPYLQYTDLRPVLDLEVNAGYTWEELSAWTQEFMVTFERYAGIEPLIYINLSYANHLSAYITNYDLWIAYWTFDSTQTPEIGPWNDWRVWQYSNGYTCSGCSSYVQVPGINYRTDLNIYNGDLNLLEQQILLDPDTNYYSNQPLELVPIYLTQPLFPE